MSKLNLQIVFAIVSSVAPACFGYQHEDLGRFAQRDPLGYLDGANLYEYLMSVPMALRDPSGTSCEAGEEVTVACAVGWYDGLLAYDMANFAFDTARDLAKTFPDGEQGLHNGRADAFRHCYWSCLMAEKLGQQQAKDITDIHEACNKNLPAEEAMDQANNATGRRFAAQGKNCFDACLNATNKGTLQVTEGGVPPRNPYK